MFEKKLKYVTTFATRNAKSDRRTLKNAVNNSYRWPPTLATASSSTSSITKSSSWLKVDLLISLWGLAQAITLTTTGQTLWQEWWHARCHQTDWYIKVALDSWMYEMGSLFGHRLWRPESTTSSPLRKANWPNWQSRNVEEWKQWPLETIEETDEERCEKGLIHACTWVFTTDLQRKAPGIQFRVPGLEITCLKATKVYHTLPKIIFKHLRYFPSICCSFGFRDIHRVVALIPKI